MDYGLYLSTAGASVQDARVDSITNNLANLHTPGFRKLIQSFIERPVESKEDGGHPFKEEPLLDKIGGGVFFHRTRVSRQSGPVEQTGRRSDVAIKGPRGYFGIQKDGERFYTRAGNFVIDKTGRLLTPGGFNVLDRSGNPISLENPVTDGFASRLMLRDFPRTAEVAKRAGNLLQFKGEGTDLDPTDRVVERHLEKSPVSPVAELVALIKAHRGYEANTRMIQAQDEALGGIISLPRPR